ncbi:hypothetical protein [Pseudobacteroides cellulosolvens]|uniref:Phospholipase C/P1 nuclease n=1 Tax=Pseudobacteroides cellulosolvens ATCC 35603 = DSM 2933 TaxID=398512 RepID=A0A0L6JIT6_9FIRM|nr:hypothetical protein [Pseudobacteroides cellulosolvens]KNY25650.1 phospholipase C/P1 nuclease [Pseudobacteroides cellulosolvens ATCC 35603 = DSM 2933]
MPSTMIHLLAAYEINPEASDLFWVGNFVPDYTNDRKFKDEIHFRNTSNRMEALRQLRKKIDNNNPFETGWLVHLFVDACWDEIMIPAFKEKYINNSACENWFVKYREETGLASYYLYHHIDWAPRIWAQIINADLSVIKTELPITQYDMDSYRERVYKRHSESNINSISLEYNEEKIFNFCKNTARKYMEWL